MDKFGNSEERMLKLSAIEDMLKQKVAIAEKKYHIDRSQEGAVDAFISDSKKDLKGIFDVARNRIEKNRKNFNYNYGMYCLVTKEEKKIMKDTVKKAEKQSSDELRIFFEKLDVRMDVYYKNGISKQHLEDILKMMKDVYNYFQDTPFVISEYEVERKPLPLSYAKKIEKWNIRLETAATDVLKEIRDEEEKEREALKDTIDKLLKDIKDNEKLLKDTQKQKESAEKTLITAKVSHEKALASRETDVEKTKEHYDRLIDTSKARELEFENSKEKIETAISEKEKELSALSFIFFVKKSKFRKEIEALGFDREDILKKIQYEKNEIMKNKKRKEEKLAEIDKKIEELKKQKAELLKKINKCDEKMTSILTKIEESKTKLESLNEKLKSFHEFFLLNKYGKTVNMGENREKNVEEKVVEQKFENTEQKVTTPDFSLQTTIETRSIFGKSEHTKNTSSFTSSSAKGVTPIGQEPANIRKRIDILFPKLDSAYPDKVITGLYKDHKKWDETARELSKLLGYENKNAFLEAYGYTIQHNASGRTTTIEPEEFIGELKRRYPDGSPFMKVSQLSDANPDLAGNMKTLANKAVEVFDMPLGMYLKKIGILVKTNTTSKAIKNYNICKVQPTGMEESLYRFNGKSISEGDYAEITVGDFKETLFGKVTEVNKCTDDEGLCEIENLKSIVRKVTKPEFERNQLMSYILANEIKYLADTVEERGTSLFVMNSFKGLEYKGEIRYACCRGLVSQIIDALLYLIGKDDITYELSDMIMVSPAIAELYVFTEDVEYVMENYPELKMAMFAHNEKSNDVLYYSRCGYSTITDISEIKGFENAENSDWMDFNSPTENFSCKDGEYVFAFAEDWEADNYIYTNLDGDKMQVGKRGIC